MDMYQVAKVRVPYGASTLQVWAIFDRETKQISLEPTTFLVSRIIYNGLQNETARGNAYLLTSFLNTLKKNSKRWDKITDSEMRKYLEGVLFKHRNLTAQSIHNHISVLKTFYSWAHARHLCENADVFSFNMSNEILEELELANADKNSKTPNNLSTKWISKPEFDNLLNHNPARNLFEIQRNEIILLLGYLCGCRAQEVTSKHNFKIKDINLAIKRADFKNSLNEGFELKIIGKGSSGGKVRTIWVPDELSQKIQLFLKNPKLSSSKHLICSKQGNPLNKQFASTLFSNFKRNLVINGDSTEKWRNSNRSFHALRHSYATNFVIDKGEDEAAKELLRTRMGHENFETTRIYITFAAIIQQKTKMQETD